jgi:cytochrome b
MQESSAAPTSPQVKVWDLLIRFGHWILVAGFAASYLTHEEADRGLSGTIHVWAGYAIGVVLLIRIVWGFTGTRYARFKSFLFSPLASFRYLGQLMRRVSPRYLGHSPAGAAMIFALILSVGGTVGTGVYLLGQEGKGPLAGYVQQVQRPERPAAGTFAPGQRPPGGTRVENPMREIHETFTNIALLLIVLHIAGVAWASFAHHENLVKSMFTGRKRAGGAETIPNP